MLDDGGSGTAPDPSGNPAGRAGPVPGDPAGDAAGLPDFRLDGRVALVTGGTRGLGLTLALALGTAGADLAVASRHASERLAALEPLRTVGRRVVGIDADLSRPEDCGRVVASAVDALGHLDILVNNAGVGSAVNALDVEPTHWDAVMDINLRGLFFTAQAAARAMRNGGGCIVNLASIAASRSGPGLAVYAAAKAAVVQLTSALAAEWGPAGIRVNAIAPGYIPTGIEAGRLTEPTVRDRLARWLPLRRLGRAEDLVGPLLLLVSPAGGFITGQTLVVDGGWLAG